MHLFAIYMDYFAYVVRCDLGRSKSAVLT